MIVLLLSFIYRLLPPQQRLRFPSVQPTLVSVMERTAIQTIVAVAVVTVNKGVQIVAHVNLLNVVVVVRNIGFVDLANRIPVTVQIFKRR